MTEREGGKRKRKAEADKRRERERQTSTVSAMHAPLQRGLIWGYMFKSFCFFMFNKHSCRQCLDPAAPLLSVFLNTCGCLSVAACGVHMHACAPLCVSKNEEERWERRVKCVCVWRRSGGGCTFKFCDICSLQLECVYFYTASHKQRARLAPLVNVPTRYDSKANEIFTRRLKEWGEERGQRGRRRKNDKIICDKNVHT